MYTYKHTYKHTRVKTHMYTYKHPCMCTQQRRKRTCPQCLGSLERWHFPIIVTTALEAGCLASQVKNGFLFF